MSETRTREKSQTDGSRRNGRRPNAPSHTPKKVKLIPVESVVWSDRQILPPFIEQLWGSGPCPHCGVGLHQEKHHLLGDTAILECPECKGLSVMPMHPLHAAHQAAVRHTLDVLGEQGPQTEALPDALRAQDAAQAEWHAFLRKQTGDAA